MSRKYAENRGNMQKIKSVSPKKAMRGSKAFGCHFCGSGKHFGLVQSSHRKNLAVVCNIVFGSTLSRAVHIDDEVTARTAKASVAFGRLLTNVWERNGIRLDTKLKVYKAVVLPTLLYACETWTVYQRMPRNLTIST